MSTQALPERMELKPGRLKWIFVFLAGAAFTAIAVFVMTDEDPLVRWGIAGFFGLVALIAVPSVIGIGSSLELNRTGFTCRTLFRTWSRTWADCSEFQPVEIGNNRFVGFSTGTDEKKHPNVAAMARAMAGTETSGALPDTYGLSAEKLADLMNRFRARALSGGR